MDFIAGVILTIFVATYLLISTEWVNRTTIFLPGIGVVGAILWAANEDAFVNVINDIECRM